MEHSIRFLNYVGDELLAEVSVPEGGNATNLAPEPEDIEGKTFVSWSEDITCVMHDMTVRPVYE